MYPADYHNSTSLPCIHLSVFKHQFMLYPTYRLKITGSYLCSETNQPKSSKKIFVAFTTFIAFVKFVQLKLRKRIFICVLLLGTGRSVYWHRPFALHYKKRSILRWPNSARGGLWSDCVVVGCIFTTYFLMKRLKYLFYNENGSFQFPRYLRVSRWNNSQLIKMTCATIKSGCSSPPRILLRFFPLFHFGFPGGDGGGGGGGRLLVSRSLLFLCRHKADLNLRWASPAILSDFVMCIRHW